MVAKPTVSKERFKRWLVAKNELFGDAVVGTAQEPLSCPIATYLTETRGHSYASVGAITVEFTRKSGKVVNFPAPRWVRNFVRDVDDLGRGAEVKASKALEIAA
jgi:hypothetical protein